MYTGVSDRVPGAQSRVAELEEAEKAAAEIEYEDVQWPFTEADIEAAEEADDNASVMSGKDMDSTAYFYKYGRRKPVEVNALPISPPTRIITQHARAHWHQTDINMTRREAP